MASARSRDPFPASRWRITGRPNASSDSTARPSAVSTLIAADRTRSARASRRRILLGGSRAAPRAAPFRRVAFAPRGGRRTAPRRFGSARNAPSLDFVQLASSCRRCTSEAVAPSRNLSARLARPSVHGRGGRRRARRLSPSPRDRRRAGVSLRMAQLFGGDRRVALVHRVAPSGAASFRVATPMPSSSTGAAADALHPLRRVVVREEPTLAPTSTAARTRIRAARPPDGARHDPFCGVRRAFQPKAAVTILTARRLELDGHLHAALRGGGRPQVAARRIAPRSLERPAASPRQPARTGMSAHRAVVG